MQTRSAATARERQRAQAEADSAEYRNGYPNNPPEPRSLKLWNFYSNQTPSRPKGDLIEVILTSWKGDYELLESHHGYIQWLFPLRELGVNWHSSAMTAEEAKEIAASPECRDRLVRAYLLMLDFYGFRLTDPDTGAVEPAENFQARIAFLNSSSHNYLRISRILKCLGELGFEHFKAPWVKALTMLCFNGERPPLWRARSACEFHWAFTLRNETERREILALIDSLVEQFPDRK